MMGSSGSVPGISIVVPSFNSAATIGRTLDSIRRQAYPCLEVICVDGASTDGTDRIIDEYRDVVSDVISEPDDGIAHALNKGFRRSSHGIRCYLNSDDEFADGALKAVGDYFTRNPGIDVLCGACQRVYEDKSSTTTVLRHEFDARLPLRNEIEQPSTFWRTSIHKVAGELDQSYRLAFDWEWWNRMRRAGARFAAVEKVLSVYHFSSENLTSRGGMRIIEEMFRVTRGYGPCFGAIAYVYWFLFRVFDMHGYYDRPFAELRRRQQVVFGITLRTLYAICGEAIINCYNWNWASKQVRGLVWYK